MLLSELGILARTKSIRPQTRLRVLIDAAPRALDVDMVSAYLPAPRIPFADSIIRARERLDVPRSTIPTQSESSRSGAVNPSHMQGNTAYGNQSQDSLYGDAPDCRFEYVRNKYRWWPFHFGGVYDRVPLFATLEPHRGTEPFTDGSEGAWVKSQSGNSFSHREMIRSYARCLGPNDRDSPLLVIYNSRSECPQGASINPRLRDYAAMLRTVASEISVAPAERTYYENITDAFVSNAQDYGAAIRSALRSAAGEMRTPDVARHHLKSFFNWLVHDLGRLCRAPDLRIHAYCVALEANDHDGVSYIQGRRSLSQPPTEHPRLVLSPYAISGLSMYSAPRPENRRDFAQLDTLCRELADWHRLSKWPTRLSDAPHWTTVSDKHFTTANNPGLVVWAAHTGLTLYVEDVHRRYCFHAPIYGAAYTTLDPLTRFNLVVPLLRPRAKLPTERNESYDSIGVVLFESRRVAAIRAKEVAYLASLLSLAAKCLPEAVFESKIRLFP